MTTQPTCPFKPGDLVRHRASGEPAIVVEACTKCAMHTHREHEAIFRSMEYINSDQRALDKCQHIYNGKVRVTTRFGRTDVCVDDWMLEAVPEKSGNANHRPCSVIRDSDGEPVQPETASDDDYDKY